jgi:hypothetical protein
MKGQGERTVRLMWHRSTSPVVDPSRPASVRAGSVTDVLMDVTGFGATLFSDDGSVPCGIMFKAEGTATQFCSASAGIRDMYEALNTFHALDEGPAPRALSASGMQVAHDTSDPTYPPFFTVPASRGFASILSVPLNLGVAGVAAVTFYAHPVGFFTPDRQRIAAVFAEQTLRTIELTLNLARSQNLTEDMRAAMQSRTSIDLATGIIMAQNRCSQDEAFGILKQVSSTRNSKLRDLATLIVEKPAVILHACISRPNEPGRTHCSTSTTGHWRASCAHDARHKLLRSAAFPAHLDSRNHETTCTLPPGHRHPGASPRAAGGRAQPPTSRVGVVQNKCGLPQRCSRTVHPMMMPNAIRIIGDQAKPLPKTMGITPPLTGTTVEKLRWRTGTGLCLDRGTHTNCQSSDDDE